MTTEDFIKRSKEIHGERYSYEKSVYKNANTKLIITCPKHGDFEQLPFPHINGQGCPKCAGRGLSQEEIIELFREVHGNEYDYSKVQFKKMRDKVCIICRKHGEFWQTPYKHHKLKQGCPKCGFSKRNLNRRVDRDKFIKRANDVHQFKYDYSEVQFNDLHDKVTIICPQHGKFEQLAYDHLHGHGCTQCAIEKSKLSKEEFIVRANKIHNFKYDYSKVVLNGTTNDVEIICPKHGSFFQNAGTHLKGCGCPRCGRVESTAERELYDYVCGLMGKENVVHNDRTVLYGMEIDIYVPSLKIGIEYNGVVWHSEKFGKDRYYHLNKLEAANRRGVKLIQIFEDEYFSRKDVVLEKIRYLLKKCEDCEKINARSCRVVDLDTAKAKKFLEENHVQGFGKSTVYLGLIHRLPREIVGIMSFKCINKEKNEWELTRFATLNGVSVRGAGGKLLKRFIRDYSPTYIKSFADRRWTLDGNNNIYTKLGFELEETLKPDYRYVMGSDAERLHKFNFRKKRLHEKYGLPLTMTESEMTDKIGAYRIWDCGLFRYVWRNK